MSLIYKAFVFWKFGIALFGIILLLTDLKVTEAEVTLTTSFSNILENSSLPLTCSYSGNFSVETYTMHVSSTGPSVGSLLADCSVFAIPPDPARFAYTCPTKKKLVWTIKKVSRANEGDTWRCSLGFTATGSGSEEASLTINISVPIQSVTMLSPTGSVVTVQENTETVFVCRTSGGLPAATIQWYKDQRTPATTNDDVEITHYASATSSKTNDDLIYVTSTLKYLPGQEDYGVKIYCTANNFIDTLSSNRKPFLNVQFFPTNPSFYYGDINGKIITEHFIDVVRGDTFTILCKSEGQPEPTYRWSGHTSDNQNMSIKSITDNLNRTCTATNTIRDKYGVNQQGSAMSTLAINVLYSPSMNDCKLSYTATSPITVTDSIDVIEGSSFTITCTANAKPTATLSWTGPGTSSSATLTVKNISKQQNGTYTVIAENTMVRSFGETKAGSATSNIVLNVLYAPKIQELNTKNIVVGSQLNISCPVVKGNPPAMTINWTRNGDSMAWNQQILHIENVSKHDDMVYTCTAQNTMKPTGATQQYGRDTASLRLNVLYKASISSFGVQGSEGLASVTVIENENIRFVCTVDSNPDSSIKIKFQGKTLYKQDNTKNLTYIHNNAACLDAGVYTCSAENQYNNGKVSLKELEVFVRCSPRPLHQVKSDSTSLLYSPTTLTFTALAYPEPGKNGFIWHKENSFTWVPLLSNADLWISSSGLQTNLTIKNVSKSDYGHYRVTVTNEIGKYEQYMFLTNGDIDEKASANTVVIVSVTLGLLSTTLALYAITVTILFKRKLNFKETLSQPLEESDKQTPIVNLSVAPEASGEAGVEHTLSYMNTTIGSDELALQQYTALARHANDDQTMYEVIQKI